MAGITVLADDVRQLADALDSVDAEFGAADRALRDLTPEDAGPTDVSTSVVEVLFRLQRRLGALAVEAGDGGRAVRRHLGDDAAAAEEDAGHGAGAVRRHLGNDAAAAEEDAP
jgi:hypothetical protein